MDDSGYYKKEILTEAAELLANNETEKAYQLLAEPLHEALYERQDFNLLDELPTPQRLVLAFDYIQSQVTQGGFIQLIQTGYVSLLVTVIEALQELEIGNDMIPVLDDVLKIFVLNKDALSRETSVEEFSKLYAEFKEFEPLEAKFMGLLQPTQTEIIKKVL